MKFSQAARCLNDPRGLVSFSPKRHRRQVRAISLNQETIEWKLARNLTQVLRVFESQIAGKRNVETEVNCVAGHLQLPPKQCMTPPGSSPESSCRRMSIVSSSASRE